MTYWIKTKKWFNGLSKDGKEMCISSVTIFVLGVIGGTWLLLTSEWYLKYRISHMLSDQTGGLISDVKIKGPILGEGLITFKSLSCDSCGRYEYEKCHLGQDSHWGNIRKRDCEAKFRDDTKGIKLYGITFTKKRSYPSSFFRERGVGFDSRPITPHDVFLGEAVRKQTRPELYE